MAASDSLVTLRVVSPCEHGVEHHIKEVITGAEFSVPECRDSRNRPRYHVASKEKYPNTVRRR